MSFKRIMVLVLTLVMIVSACSPAIHAFDGVLGGDDHDHASGSNPNKDINYVSLGDSMTNGLGLPEYDALGQAGFLEVAPDSYPAQFAAWLAGAMDGWDSRYNKDNPETTLYTGTKGKVYLAQLATTGVRAEDLLYLLTVEPRMLNRLGDASFEAPYNLADFQIGDADTCDSWTISEIFGNTPDDWGKAEWASYMALAYQSYVADADIISLSIGNTNFGAYLFDVVMSMVEGDNTYDYMTFENALELCGTDATITNVVKTTYSDLKNKLADMNLSADLVDRFVGVATYITANYAVSYTEILNRIEELNPDVEVVILPLINNMYGINADVVYDGKTYSINLGDIFAVAQAPVNAYLAAYPAAMQLKGEFEEISFYFAEISDENEMPIKIDTLTGKYAEMLNTPVSGKKYPAERTELHEIFLPAVIDLIFPELFADSDAYQTLTVNDVKEFEVAKAGGIEAFAEYIEKSINLDDIDNVTESSKPVMVAYYLGIVNAIVTSMNSDICFDIDALISGDLSAFNFLSLLDDVTSNVEGRLDNATADVDTVYEWFVNSSSVRDELPVEIQNESLDKLLEELEREELSDVKEMALNVAEAIVAISVAPEAMGDELCNSEIVELVLSLYGKVLVGNGLATHPSEEGHKVIADAVINAYENNHTVKDESIENIAAAMLIIAGLVVEFYDDAYAYGYDYLEDKGYISTAVDALDKAIAAIYDAIDEVESGFGLGETQKFRDELRDELLATIDTLTEIREVLAQGKASDVYGFASAILALGDDLQTHIDNIGDILARAGIDTYDLAILPALKEALRILNDDVIPALKVALDEFIVVATEFIIEALDWAYIELTALSKEAYALFVATMIKLQIYAGEKAEELEAFAIKAFNMILAKMMDISDSFMDAMDRAAVIFAELVDKALKLNTDIMDTLDAMAKVFNELVDEIYAFCGDAEDAYNMARKVFANIVTDIVNTIGDAVNTVEHIKTVFNKAVNDLVNYGLDVYSATKIAVKVIGTVAKYVIKYAPDAIEFAKEVVAFIIKAAPVAAEILDITVDIFTDLVKFVIENEDDVREAIEIAKGAFEFVFATAKEIYGDVNKAIEVATKVFVELGKIIVSVQNTVEDAVAFAKEAAEFISNAVEVITENIEKAREIAADVVKALVEVSVKVHGAIDVAKQVLAYVADILVEVYGDAEKAWAVANEIYALILDVAKQCGNDVNALILKAEYVYEEILRIIAEAYGFTQDTIATAKAIYKHFVETVLMVKAYAEESIYEASNASYELKDNSLYVAIGNTPYGEALANKLNLGEKYFQYGLRENYLEKLPEADLITVNLDDGQYYDFAEKQINGKIAEIVRNNDSITQLSKHPLIGAYVATLIAELGIDVEAQTEELDWDKYLSADAQDLLDMALAEAKVELIERGVPEYFYFELQPYVDEVLEGFGLLGLPGFAINVDPIVIPTADLAVYAIENALYEYAAFNEDLANVLDDIYTLSPDATVVLTGFVNPLDVISLDLNAYGLDFVNYDDCYYVADLAIDVLNAHMYAAAVANEKTIFVENGDESAIYDALHVYCNHVYDDCLDPDCNRCLEVRVVTGHTFKYVSNDNATCTKDGTKTGTCVVCGAKETVTDVGSMKPHTWKDATCTTAKTCKVCGTTSGRANGHKWVSATCTEAKYCEVCKIKQGEPNGHKYGDWTVLDEADYFKEGLREHTCRVCGHVEQEVIPVVQPKYPASTIITVIVSAVLFSAVVGTLILWRLRKQDILKD